MGVLGKSVRLALIVLIGVSLCPLMAQNNPNDPTTIRQIAGARFLRGAIDMHFHMDPPTLIVSGSPGADIATVRLARSLGLRGLVIKSHSEPTAALAYQLRRDMPGFELFGGVVLNRANGGINVAVVEHLAEIKGTPGRVVWMPTLDSEASAKGHPGKPFVAVSRNGELLPEVKDVIAVIAKNGLVLATGHLGPEDALMVLREGQSQGVKHMIATHPMDLVGKMNMDQLMQAVRYGAFLEFDSRMVLAEGGVEADAMRKIGPEHCFISEFWTEKIPVDIPRPFIQGREYGNLDFLGGFVEEMHARGFTDHDLDLMVKENPARLLDLPAQ